MKRTGTILTASLFALSLGAVACGKKAADTKKDDKAPTTSASMTDSKKGGGDSVKAPTDTKPAGQVGLANPANDPKVVATVKKLLDDCGKTMDESTQNDKLPNQKKSLYSCDKYNDDFGNVQMDGSAKTFVNLLEDPDVKVRAVASYGLSKDSSWYQDKDMAQRVITALKNEKAPSPIDHTLAIAVVEYIPSDMGFDDQIKAIAMDPNTAMDVKLAIMAWWHGPAAYDVVKANAGSTDPAMINAVVQGYVNHFEDHTDEACAYWADHLETANDTANQYALGHLTGGWGGNTVGDSESEDYITGGGGGPGSSDKRCSEAQLQKAVDMMTKQFAAGKLDTSNAGYALAFLAKDTKTPPAVKTATVALLKQMVEKKDDSYGRTTAVQALFNSGDADLKAYVNGFASDPDLKSTIDELNKPQP